MKRVVLTILATIGVWFVTSLAVGLIYGIVAPTYDDTVGAILALGCFAFAAWYGWRWAKFQTTTTPKAH